MKEWYKFYIQMCSELKETIRSVSTMDIIKFILQYSPMTQSNFQFLYTVCMPMISLIDHMNVIM